MQTISIRQAVLAGFAALCVTPIFAASEKIKGDPEFTKDQIVPSIESGGAFYPGELQYAVTDWLVGSAKVFVTVHGGREGSFSRVAIYRQLSRDGNATYRLLRQIDGGPTSYFEPPRLIKNVVDGPTEMIHIREVGWGTAHAAWDYLFAAGPSGELNRLELDDPVAAFEKKYGFKEGQGIRKGVQNDLSQDQFTFGFYIWNPGDANCCPTGGWVTGTYKLNLDRDRLVIDKIHFSPKPAR